MRKRKNFILPALTSLVLISCVIFTLCVYNRSNNAKALTESESMAADDGASSGITGSGSAAGPDSVTEPGSATSDSITESGNTEDNNIQNVSSSSSEEMRGIWISFLDFSSKGYTRASFTKHIKTMFNQCQKDNFNTVFVHVRMFSDAMYNSEYFPWSQYASGKIGRSLGI